MSRTYRHPVFARIYPRLSRAAEEAGAAEHRRVLLAGLEGRVIEVGAGHGLNFPYYPRAVSELVILGAARLVPSTTPV